MQVVVVVEDPNRLLLQDLVVQVEVEMEVE
jgi:hypothetical protein